MRYPFLAAIVTLSLGSQLGAQWHQPTGEGEGYFFPPSRGLYFFRPDLYVYRIPPYRSWYGPSSYRRPYYLPPSRLNYPVAGAFGTAWPLRYGGGPAIYRVVLSPAPTGGFVRANTADLIFSVTPPQAMVYIDGRLIGSARDFSTERNRFTLLDGEHDLRVEYPGYAPFEAQLQVVADRTLHLDIQLEKRTSQPEGNQRVR